MTNEMTERKETRIVPTVSRLPILTGVSLNQIGYGEKMRENYRKSLARHILVCRADQEKNEIYKNNLIDVSKYDDRHDLAKKEDSRIQKYYSMLDINIEKLLTEISASNWIKTDGMIIVGRK